MDKLLERIAAAQPDDAAVQHGGFSAPMDEVMRQSHYRMIRSLTRAYRQFGFQLLVDQATMGKSGVDDLSDDELIGLHRDLDRARECLQDGITFEEAGLLRSRYA